MIWILVAAAFAGESKDFRSHLDQAKFFLRKEWYDDALEELEKAVSTDDGKLDPEAWFMLAKVRYELGDLPGARQAADRALVHSRDQDQARQTHELLSFFDQKFGYVRVEAPVAGTSTHLALTLESTLFDPDLKRWVNRVVEGLEAPVTLPHELGLPAATYTINGLQVEVVAGSTQSISPQLDRAVEPPLRSVRVELGVGASAALGARVSNLLPAPSTELSLGFPIGPLELGVLGSWQVQPFQTRTDAVLTAPGVFGVGVRAGVGVPLSKLELRPSATWRLVSVPGVEVGCAQQEADWTCDSAVSSSEDLFVYTAALVHAVGVELAATTHAAPLGFGVKTAGELFVGALPREGRALGPEGELQFTVDGPRGVSAGSWRLLATVQWRPTTR
ncbi:MAG: tetratricopeptide repeat protein [Myxococcota bacterium]